MTRSSRIHPTDEMLPLPTLAALGLQHVLLMYVGAVIVPLIMGRALKLLPEDVTFLISADLFVSGIMTLIQSLGMTRWFGIRLPVMMGVAFTSIGPMIPMINSSDQSDTVRIIFGTIMGAGIAAMVIAPLISRLLRFFPPIVLGTIILVIGITLMRVSMRWIFSNPVEQTIPTMGNVVYTPLSNIVISAIVLVSILLLFRFTKGFIANIAVFLGIIVGGIISTLAGIMNFDRVADATWFALVMPFYFGMPIFKPFFIVTMTIVIIVLMIESTGIFLAIGEMTGKRITQQMLSAGLRTHGLSALIGGIFSTFPYTSFSQNAGLVEVTGVKSRFVCVAAGVILIILGFFPKMAALVESLPIFVLGGASLVIFGTVAATGIRILSSVDFQKNHNNLFIIAISLSVGLIPLLEPNFKQGIPREICPLIDSGILLSSISAVLLNLFFNKKQ